MFKKIKRINGRYVYLNLNQIAMVREQDIGNDNTRLEVHLIGIDKPDCYVTVEDTYENREILGIELPMQSEPKVKPMVAQPDPMEELLEDATTAQSNINQEKNPNNKDNTNINKTNKQGSHSTHSQYKGN